MIDANLFDLQLKLISPDPNFVFQRKDVDLYNTTKRNAVIESSDLMRNISWLVSCFFKIKNPISIVQEIKE